MLSDDELGAVLAKRLWVLVADIEPSSALTERLDREIRRSHVARRGRLSRRLHRWMLAVSIPAVAAVAAVIVLLGGSDVTPSFAVTRSADGSILVTLNDIEGVTGANTRLRELGVTNVVVVPVTGGCATHVDLTYMGIGAQRPTTIRVTSAEIASGSTVLLAARRIAANTIELALGRVTGSPPSCVAPGQTGPGISSSFPHTSLTPAS